MNPHDNFWRLAMRHAYEDSWGGLLNAVEQAALLPLQAGYRAEKAEEPIGPAAVIEWGERLAAEALA